MKITKKWLKSYNACAKGIEFVENEGLIGLEVDKFVKRLIKLEKLDYGNWLIVRVLSKVECVKYAVYSAELVLPIWQKRYLENNRPALAIEVAKKWLENSNINISNITATAAYAADAADATTVANITADTYAGYAAAYAAYAAAYAANAADATTVANIAAANAANASNYYAKTMRKIIKYGLKLYKKEDIVPKSRFRTKK